MSPRESTSRPRRSRFAVASLATCAIAILAAAPQVRADDVLTTDGHKFSGRIVAQDKSGVTLQMSSGGISLRKKFAPSQIKSIVRELREGPGYYPLPIIGGIGREVTAEALREAMVEVRKNKPDYVVLVIDSPGGNVAEMARIVQVIQGNKDLHFIAYVKFAMSAGAVIAMACPDIYVAPEGTIGAAVPYQVGPKGTPEAIEEKFESAMRAQLRTIAESAGHSPLIMEGMMNRDLVLAVDKDLVTGRPTVVDLTGKTIPDDAHIIKSAGKIITLTASEAVGCGLAVGTAPSADALKTSLGLAAWHKVDDLAWQQMAAKAASLREQLAAQEAWRTRGPTRNGGVITSTGRPGTARAAYFRKVAPDLERLDADIDKARARLKDADAALAPFVTKYNTDAEAIDREYDDAVARAKSTNNFELFAGLAGNVRNRKMAKLRLQFDQDTQDLQKTRDDAASEVNRLIAKGRTILASAPTD